VKNLEWSGMKVNISGGTCLLPLVCSYVVVCGLLHSMFSHCYVLLFVIF
jgi:hypothetical protein